MTGTPREIVQRYIDAWGTADAARRRALFERVLAPDFSDVMPGGRRTRAQLIAEADRLHAAGYAPAPRIEQLVVEGEWVAARTTWRHTEPSTRATIAVDNPFFARVADGRMVEGYGFYDRLAELEQLEHRPPPDTTGDGATVALIRAITDAFNRHDLDAIMACFAEDAILLTPRGADPWGTRYAGHAAVREGLAARFTGIPDVHYGDDRHWASGELGVSEWLLTGTTTSGERLEVRGCDHWTVRDGKVVVKDSYWKIVDR